MRVGDKVVLLSNCGDVIKHGVVVLITKYNVLIEYTKEGKRTGIKENFCANELLAEDCRLKLKVGKEIRNISLGINKNTLERNINFKDSGWC